MNKKGVLSQAFLIILVIAVVALIYLYPLGGKKNIDEFKDKWSKLDCPDVTNITNTCTQGTLEFYNDDRGCVVSKCVLNSTIGGPLSEKGTLQVFFLDVGQGDGIYIETPDEKHIVIDSGKGPEMADFLVFRGINRIDWLIATHPDADHIGGMDEILENTVVLNYLETNTECTTVTCQAVDTVLAREEGIHIYSGGSGGFELTNVDLDWEILSPNDGFDFKDDNDNSFVIRLTYGEVQFLFTGDCSEDCEEMLVLLDKDVSADILKVGHHGSKYSTTAAFLTKVQPAYGVLSYGMTNPYGHPSKETIDRLATMNVKLVRTASAGNIEVRTDGTKLEWHCEKKEDCFV